MSIRLTSGNASYTGAVAEVCPLKGHSSISRYRSPALSASACTSRSRWTIATTASRPSIPGTGGSTSTRFSDDAIG